MRNKIYVYVTAALFLMLLVWCPVSFLLDKAGIIKIGDLANYKNPEKLYYYDYETESVKSAGYSYSYQEDEPLNELGELSEFDEADESELSELHSSPPLWARAYMGLLNGIENGKAGLDTVYTNYLPFYGNVLNFVNSSESRIQADFVLMLYNFEDTEATTMLENSKEDEPVKNTDGGIDDSNNNNNYDVNTPTATEPIKEEAPMQFISSKIRDAGMFRVYQVRSADNSVGFLDISMAMAHETAAKNMLDEQANINRIAAANTDVNFFVYIATRMQDTAYYNKIIPSYSELSTKDIFDDFVNGITGVSGLAWFDIDTFEERMERCFKTDHHWNALGAYQGYTEVIDMMGKVVTDIGEPLPLKGLIEFPNVEYRGSGAGRTQTRVYYDPFAVMDIDLPKQHPTEKVKSKLNEYLSGEYDTGNVKDIYISHYENFYNRPSVITYPENNTGRKLLILGDSYTYWVSWLIGTHFDKTYVHYTLDQKNLDYNKFIRDNGITDVLLLQYSARTLSKATSAEKYLEQIITR